MDEPFVLIIIISIVSFCFIVEYYLFFNCYRSQPNNNHYINDTSSESSVV